MLSLSTPIEKIPRIGSFYQKRLKRLGIKTIRDLFFHFPHRYEDFSDIVSISEVKLNETACIQGKILEIKNSRTWKRKMALTQAVVEDETGSIKVVWFNQPYLIKSLKEGYKPYRGGTGPDKKQVLDNNKHLMQLLKKSGVKNFTYRDLSRQMGTDSPDMFVVVMCSSFAPPSCFMLSSVLTSPMTSCPSIGPK